MVRRPRLASRFGFRASSRTGHLPALGAALVNGEA